MMDSLRWYAVYTLHLHEKKVAELLRALGLEAYVPTIQAHRRWQDGRTFILDVPVFPGYVFVGVWLVPP
jgi:transcription antitermination factor NusG